MWIGRIVLSLMNIAVWWYTLIFLCLSMIYLQYIGVRVTLGSPLSVWSLWAIWRLRAGVCLLAWWCHDNIHRRILKTLFGHPDLLHRWSIPAVSTDIIIGGSFLQLVPILAQVKPDKVDGSIEGPFVATHVVLGSQASSKNHQHSFSSRTQHPLF